MKENSICEDCKHSFKQVYKPYDHDDGPDEIIICGVVSCDCSHLIKCEAFEEKPKREYTKEMVETSKDKEQLEKNREKEKNRRGI